MSGRTWSRYAARSVASLGVLVLVTAASLVLVNRTAIHTVDSAGAVYLITPIGYLVIGSLLASRLPQNPIGWMLLSMTVISGLTGLCQQYVLHDAYIHQLPFTPWAAWLFNWLIFLIFPTGLFFFFFLLFPDGRFHSPRWRGLGWVGAAIALAVVAFAMLQPMDQVGGAPAIRNPIGQAWTSNVLAGNAFWDPALGLLIVSMAALILRIRSSTGVKRQQLKWMAAAIVTACLLLSGGFDPSFPASGFDVLFIAGFGFAIPIACGVAILRHNLYEIDRIISRTASYGIVTGLLIGVYVGCVALLTDVLPLGGNIGTAASVLVAVALFAPLRRRVQTLVDRRFNRSRYDTERVITEFSDRLRDEVDLEVLRTDLLRVVRRTVAPSGAALWLRRPR